MEDKVKKFIKNKNNHVFAIILILGIVMMLVSGGGDKKEGEFASEEKRLENILNNIDGVGKTNVYITFDEEKGLNSTKEAVSAVILVNEDNSYVKKMVSEVTSNVLEIPIHKVMIVKNK